MAMLLINSSIDHQYGGKDYHKVGRFITWTCQHYCEWSRVCFIYNLWDIICWATNPETYPTSMNTMIAVEHQQWKHSTNLRLSNSKCSCEWKLLQGNTSSNFGSRMARDCLEWYHWISKSKPWQMLQNLCNHGCHLTFVYNIIETWKMIMHGHW